MRTCSAVEKTGIDTIWSDINHFYDDQSSELKERRQHQLIQWMDQLVKESLLKSFLSSVGASTLESYKEKVKAGELTPYQSSQELLKIFKTHS